MGKEHTQREPIRKRILFLLWLAAVILVLVNRDRLSAEAIAEAGPESMILSSVFMLILFALKSVTIVIHSGVLYTALALMYSYPYALVLGTIGTLLMIVIPYVLGRVSDPEGKQKLLEKYELLRNIKEDRQKTDFGFALYMRIMGMIPSDVMGFYMGSEKLDAVSFTTASLIGLFPGVVFYVSLAAGLKNADRRMVITAVCIQGLRLLASGILALLKGKRVLSIYRRNRK